jgi:hypothetical protein
VAIIQVWSAPSCETGAVCFGALAPWVSASGSEATGTPEAFRVTVPRSVADGASLAEGRCLRVLSQSRGEQWWFVSSVADSDGDAGLVSVTAGPLRQLLTVRGLVRDGGTFAFSTGKRSVTDLLNTYVLTNLADDSLSWLSLGTIDYPDLLEIGALSNARRAAVLDAIEGQTGHTARLRALYTSGVLTGFALDVVADPAAGLETVPLTTGASLATVQRTRDALRAATVVVPFTANSAPMDQTEWTVDSTSGSAPAWILLRDAVTGSPWPIREDDQLIGAYLQQRDGTQSQITDSRASDSAVQIASVGTITAGDVVTIVRDTAGFPVLELTAPAGVSGPRGRLVGTVATRVTEPRRNLALNGTFGAWTNATTPQGWQGIGTAPMPIAGRYPRTTPLTWTGTSNAAYAGGVFYSTLSYTGAAANAILLSREVVRLTNGVTSVNITIADSVGLHQADGSGAGTVAVVAFRPAATIASGSTLTLVAARRPTSLPDDGVAIVNAMHVWNAASPTGNYLQSSPITAIYDSSRATLRAAAGFSMRSSTGSGVTAGCELLLLNAGTGAFLAPTTTGSVTVPALGTASETLSASAVLTGTTSVALGVGNAAPASMSVLCRWASLWLDENTSNPAMGPLDGSGSNQLWHRAQDVLASSASGTRYIARGVDLVRLQQEHGTLALGQMVRLRSDLLGLDATVKIVKLDYDFTATESLSLELGSITPRLTGVTVSL